MSEKRLVLCVWAAVILLLIGSMALAGFFASRRPEYLARPGLATCAAAREPDALISPDGAVTFSLPEDETA